MLKRKGFKYSIKDPDMYRHIEAGRELIWESKNGKKILLRDMDYNHIKNAYAKMKRGEYDHWLLDFSVEKALLMELRFREMIELSPPSVITTNGHNIK
tara:strand:+ start:330 stop:623 length:294 start_codon:yes stop_codon:yes gene_type:complete